MTILTPLLALILLPLALAGAAHATDSYTITSIQGCCYPQGMSNQTYQVQGIAVPGCQNPYAGSWTAVRGTCGGACGGGTGTIAITYTCAANNCDPASRPQDGTEPCVNTAACACQESYEERDAGCPAGQSGQHLQRRTTNQNNVCGQAGAWADYNNTCTATCTQSSAEVDLGCAAGQTGQHMVRRYKDFGNVCGATHPDDELGNTCAAPTCTQSSTEIDLGCKPGETGQHMVRRYKDYGDICGATHADDELTNTCAPPPVCTQASTDVDLGCAAGQTGQHKVRRFTNYGNVCGATHEDTLVNSCAAPTCTQSSSDVNLGCPAGQTGQHTVRRYTDYGSVCGATHEDTLVNSCAAPACTQSSTDIIVDCPTGQTGEHKLRRYKDYGNVCGAIHADDELTNSCAAPVDESAAILLKPLAQLGKYSFDPNQLGGNLWYRPGGSLINGHIADSFADLSQWPHLAGTLKANKGMLGIYGAEVGYMTKAQLVNLRSQGIGVTVEMPGWTQNRDAAALAKMELAGARLPGNENGFNSIFTIAPGTAGRSNPDGHGWLMTKDGFRYAPDEIVLDERSLGLLANYDYQVVFNTSIPIEQRLQQAKRDDAPNLPADPEVREQQLLDDYVTYAKEVKAQYAATPPALSFHWNVNVGWEWRNPDWLRQINGQFYGPEFEDAYRYLKNPSHVGAKRLDQLLTKLCTAGVCPRTVYMDVDMMYLTSWAMDDLRAVKTVLQQHGVGFGIDVVDECNASDCTMGTTDGANVTAISQPGVGQPQLTQRSMMFVLNFLISQNIVDSNTQLRIQSWTPRPVELGAQVNENNQFSFADTANVLFDNTLVPRGWAQPGAGLAAASASH